MTPLPLRLDRLPHLSDESISRLIAGELGTMRGMRVRRHIGVCWQCRSRYEALEKAAILVAELRNQVTQTIRESPSRRAMLVAELRHRSEAAQTGFLAKSPVSHLRTLRRLFMHPVITSVVIVAAATCLLFWVWQGPTPSMSAAGLLSRAEASELSVSGKNGVLYQTVRITARHLHCDHAIYRDLQGKRHRRRESVKAAAQPVQAALAAAGVDWDAPLSAVSYRKWRDSQPSIADQVHREGANLKLISRVLSRPGEEQSLTVRLSDFHPIERTIETPSTGTIEIAELSYAVLPWQGVNEALFEPEKATPETHSALLARSLPTPEQMDSAELEARLVLNRLHADEGEQITITRDRRSVEVKGIVDTDERKRKIVSALEPLAHVKPELFSIAELEAAPGPTASPSPMNAQSVTTRESPIAKYLQQQTQSQITLDDASQQLLDAALRVRQNAAELTSLVKRFPTDPGVAAQPTSYTELLASYSARLSAGLDAESGTLSQLGLIVPAQTQGDVSPGDLMEEVQHNDALARELIAGTSGSQRTAIELAAELNRSVERIRRKVIALTSSE